MSRSDAVVVGQGPMNVACLRFVTKPPDDEEMLVLAHIAAGLTDEELARVLSMSIGKVRWAARSVIAKLGATNRPHAVVRAVAMGYLQVVEKDLVASK